MIHIEQEPSFVLRRENYKENSYLLDVFGLNLGYFRACARIPQHQTYRQTNSYALFSLLHLTGRRKGELANFWQSDIQCNFLPQVGKDFLNYMYLNEIILTLLPLDDPAPELFYQYLCALQHPTAPALRHFEFALLKHIGLLPDILGKDAFYKLDCSKGVAVLCPAQQGYSRDVLEALFEGEPDWSHPQTRHLLQNLIKFYSQRRTNTNTRKIALSLKNLLKPVYK